jgi:hypothetical protein
MAADAAVNDGSFGGAVAERGASGAVATDFAAANGAAAAKGVALADATRGLAATALTDNIGDEKPPPAAPTAKAPAAGAGDLNDRAGAAAPAAVFASATGGAAETEATPVAAGSEGTFFATAFEGVVTVPMEGLADAEGDVTAPATAIAGLDILAGNASTGDATESAAILAAATAGVGDADLAAAATAHGERDACVGAKSFAPALDDDAVATGDGETTFALATCCVGATIFMEAVVTRPSISALGAATVGNPCGGAVAPPGEVGIDLAEIAGEWGRIFDA